MSSLRLVLVGNKGAGKSSAGNTILGKKEFKACFSFKAVTTQCQKGEAKVDGKTVMVVDTPGIDDFMVSREDAKDRVAECFPMSAPGPHAFLLVIKIGRFTPEDKRAVEVIREVFGEAALEHTMVLFTHGDELEKPDNLDTLLSGCGELKHLLDKVIWRYHVFDNKRNGRTQVIELLNKIDKMVGEQGHYTSELFQEAEEKRKEKQEKERMRREMEELRQEWNEKPELRILLIGNTTKANRTASEIILPGELQHSVTSNCQKKNGKVFGRRVTVVETPGLSDDIRDLKEIMNEIKMCICLTSPGPHAFVIVEEPGQSTERKDTLDMMKDVFGDQVLKYAFLLIIESSKNSDQSYDSHSFEVPRLPVVTFHTHDSTYGHRQLTSLLQEIDNMVHKNGGSFFTDEMFSKTEKAIREAEMKILEKKKSEIIKSRRVRWEEYEKSEEWREIKLEARRVAESKNEFATAVDALLRLKYCYTGILAIVGTVLGASIAGPIGAGIGLAVGSTVGLTVNITEFIVMHDRVARRYATRQKKCTIQ